VLFATGNDSKCLHFIKTKCQIRDVMELHCNTDVCFWMQLLLSFSVYLVLICSSGNYNPHMDNGAFVSHVICAVCETRNSFQMYNQLLTLCFWFVISMKILSDYVHKISLMQVLVLLSPKFKGVLFWGFSQTLRLLSKH